MSVSGGPAALFSSTKSVRTVLWTSTSPHSGREPLIFLLLLCLLALSSPAAAAEGPAAPQPPSAPSSVFQRALSTGTSSLSLDYDYYSTDARFGSSGAPEPQPSSTRRSGHTLTAGLTYGFSPVASVALRLPVLYPLLENAQYTEALHNPTPWMGDVEAAFRRALTRRLRSPFYGTQLEALLRLPTGLQTSGDPGEALLTGTGVTELELALLYARNFSPLIGLSAEVRGTRPFSSVVGYLESASGQGDARFAPGMRGSASLLLEISPAPRVGFYAGGRATVHGPYLYGRTSSALFPTEGLETLPGSDGRFAEGTGGVLLRLAQDGPLLDLHASWRFLGRELDELAALGLTRFSPPPGLTLGGGLRRTF